jgi:uncharacterized repeat protein (TIGR03943 family)
MSIIAIVILIMDGFLNNTSNDKKHNHEKQSKAFYLPLIFVISIALFLPAKSLSSATISQRSSDAGSIVTTAESRPIQSLFSGSSKSLSIGDWSRIIPSNNDPGYYVNKPAKISGFIYDGGLGPDVVMLARFIVTCCAVDAVPVTIPVQIENWQTEYIEDEWLEVEGSFKQVETTNGDEIVLIPELATNIEQPSNPYAN